jgi:glycosyltransferase involved in cell wall biosynthesis
MKYLVAQLGARMHYAIPRMLHDAGMLARFTTDICAVKGWPRLLKHVPESIRPAGLKRLLGRVPNGVPPEQITSFTQFGWEWQRRRTSCLTPAEMTKTQLWAGKRFCELVLADGFHGADAVFAYNRAGLELLREARKQGLRAVMEQTIAPLEIEGQLLLAEHEGYPDWEPPLAIDPARDEYTARERAEWAEADLILCGSEFVREGIAACGGPVEKCRVVPYGVDARFTLPPKVPHDGPLRVLTAGAVGLRKGSPYVLEAAKMLRGQAVFRMVGSLGVQPAVRGALDSALELTGPVPRAQMLQQYAWADVFLLPSICEGSATVVYEALAAGLPVVCTPNTGSVVRDGVDGFIVSIRNAEAIADSLLRFVRNPQLLREMGTNAKTRASEFALGHYQKRLLAAVSDTSDQSPHGYPPAH